MANYIGTLQDENKNNFYPHSAYDIKQIENAGTADFFSDIYAYQFNRNHAGTGHLVVRVGNATRASAFMMVIKGHYYDYSGTTEWQATCYFNPDNNNFSNCTCTIDNRMQIKTITWAADVNKQVYLIFNYYQSLTWNYGTIYIDKVYACWNTINFRKLICSDWDAYLTTDLSPFILTMDCTRRGDLLDAYPVGAVYISTTNQNPGDIFGGTWTQILGRYLIAVDPSTGMGHNTSRKEVGEWTHNHSQSATGSTAITVAQMPSHSHGRLRWGGSSGTTASLNSGGSAYRWNWDKTGNDSDGFYIEYTGGGQGHTHTNPSTNYTTVYPPAYTVYMWERIA